MAWKQVLNPNLDNDPKHPLYVYQGGKILTDWYGWCLAVVAASYGAKGSSYSAKTAWQSCKTKHKDRKIPEYRWVPLWYEGGDYGHVVMGFVQNGSITIYSSPYVHQATFQRFDGKLDWALDYIGKVYGVGAYSGWSETVLDSRVLEWEEDKKVEEPTKPSEPTQNGSQEPTGQDSSEPQPNLSPDTSSGDSTNPDSETKSDGNTAGAQDEFAPVETPNAQLIGGIIEEAGSGFEFNQTTKLIAYLVGDALLVGALLIPDIVNVVQAPNPAIWGEYMSKVLLEAGIAVLTVFKLFKKKEK